MKTSFFVSFHHIAFVWQLHIFPNKLCNELKILYQVLENHEIKWVISIDVPLGIFKYHWMYSTLWKCIHWIFIDKPQLTKNNETVSAKIFDEALLGVTITSSNPTLLSVYWYKSSIHIYGSRYHGGTTSIPSLTIKNVQSADDGTYKCTIDNGVGTASVDINLITWSKYCVTTMTFLYDPDCQERLA